jgi:IS605 OrfB family transposase
MKTSWLSYSKTILEKVSFDKKLFAKEFRKALKKLAFSEKKQLIRWSEEQYGIDLATIKLQKTSFF